MKSVEWKLKKDAEPTGSSDGFWYDITDGGYIDLNNLLDDDDQIKKANDAIDLLCDLRDCLEENELLNEF
jgi:hypothetical protein